jgi:hypothetical protein
LLTWTRALASSIDTLSFLTTAATVRAIWAKASNIYASACTIGFHTYAGAAGTGTSLTVSNVWAQLCTSYGFHITQLTYSSFINCVGQDCTTRNWYVEGNSGGLSACYSLQFYGCASEGAGAPFYFKKVRELTVDNPRIITPAATVDFITMDDSSGSFRDYSTVSAPGGGFYHLNVLNHGSGNGSIIVNGGDITVPTTAAVKAAITQVGGNINSTRRFASNNALMSGSASSPAALAAANNDYSIGEDVSILRLTPAGGGSTITGMKIGAASFGTNGQRVLLQNVSSADAITLSHLSGASTAGYRFALSGGVNLVIPVLGSAEVWYDAITGVWRQAV